MIIDIELLKPYLIGIPNCYSSPNLPEGKLKNAVMAYEIEPDEKVLFLIDLTVWGSAKDSWILTDKNIYFNYMKSGFSIPYSHLNSVSSKGGNILINDYPKAYFGIKTSANKFGNLLLHVIDARNNMAKENEKIDVTLGSIESKPTNKLVEEKEDYESFKTKIDQVQGEIDQELEKPVIDSEKKITDVEIVTEVSETVGTIIGSLFVAFILSTIVSALLYYLGLDICSSSIIGVIILIISLFYFIAKGPELLENE